MAKSDRNRQEQLRDFIDLCERVGFHLEPFQKKIAGALLGPEREKLVTLPRKNGKSRLIGTFAAWHLLTTPRAQAYIAANSEELDEVGWHSLVREARTLAADRDFRELVGLVGRALELKDELDADELRWLLGPELLRKYLNENEEEVPCST